MKSAESVPEYRYRRQTLGIVSAVQRRACAFPRHAAGSKAVRCQSLPTETTLCAGGEAQRRAESPGLQFSHDDLYGLNKRVPDSQTGAQRNCFLRTGGVISTTWAREGRTVPRHGQGPVSQRVLGKYGTNVAPSLERRWCGARIRQAAREADG